MGGTEESLSHIFCFNNNDKLILMSTELACEINRKLWRHSTVLGYDVTYDQLYILNARNVSVSKVIGSACMFKVT